MARRPLPSAKGITLDVEKANTSLKQLTAAIDKSVSSLKAFALSPVTSNLAQSRADIEGVAARGFGGAAQTAAGFLAGAQGSSFVSDVRDTLGKFSADQNSGARLEALARKFAAAGLEPDRKFLEGINPFIQAQAGAEERAARTANDISGESSTALDQIGEAVYQGVTDASAWLRRLMSGGVGTARR